MSLGNNFMARGYMVKPIAVTTYMKGKEKKKLGRFTLAVADNSKDDVDYLNFTIFNENSINFLTEYSVQGSQVLVQASIHNSVYSKTVGKGDDKTEEKVYSVEIIAHQVELLSNPKSYYENMNKESTESEVEQ